MSCNICVKHKTIRDFTILESDDLILSHMPPTSDHPQVYLGYCFIEPKAHVTRYEELSDEQARLIGLWTRKLSLAHSELLQAQRTYFFKFADITPHFHV